MGIPIISILLAVPLTALLALLFVPKANKTAFKWITLGATFVQLVISLIIYFNFDSSLVGVNDTESIQFVEKYDWIDLNLGSLGAVNIDFFVGIDGISVTMVLLSSIVMLIGTISSWKQTNKPKGYFALYLILCIVVPGCFVALDMFLFYLFFEFMLLPMYFLIGMWGGPRREYASIKFFLYTLFGSLLILVVMIVLYNAYGEAGPQNSIVHSFNIIGFTDQSNILPGSLLDIEANRTLFGIPAREMCFLLIFFGFAIKLPSVPFHTWLPDAHVEAPTAISVVLAGILLKIGGYGLIRLGYAIFPQEAFDYTSMVALLGVISIIYGGFNALAQKDLKKLIAYSSVSHMGFVLLGLASMTSEGTSGAIYQMFSHGLIASMLFVVSGVIYDRSGDRTIENYKGLASKMPYFTAFATVAFFASLGLPGFSGFIGEILVFLGAFNSSIYESGIPAWMVYVAITGIILSAGYYLWVLQRMFFGKFWIKDSLSSTKLSDLNGREYLILIVLGLLTLIFGVLPSLVTDNINASVEAYMTLF